LWPVAELVGRETDKLLLGCLVERGGFVKLAVATC
jgi:hypothetical protein